MALKIKHKEVEFGIGDRIKVFQRIKEGDKTRVAFFDGMVLAIKGETGRKMFTVRRIGEAAIGIERIFPVDLPTKRAKLYYTRNKAPKEIDKIYWRSNAREKSKLQKEVKTSKKVKKTKTSKAKK